MDAYHFNDPPWTPADPGNGPWFGDGACHVRDTATGPTSWGSNWGGGPNDVNIERNPDFIIVSSHSY